MSGLAFVGWIALGALGFAAATFVSFMIFVMWRYGPYITHVFQRKPLLVAPPCQPTPGSEEVVFATRDGRKLQGSYLRTPAPVRRGVILCCHEFHGSRWAWEPYLRATWEAGYDLFAFDFCNHGDSDFIAGYDPLQWITAFEVEDVRAAVRYLKTRSDADAHGIGLFGVSKGGAAALAAAPREPTVRAVVTECAYPNHGTIIEYELRWVGIFTKAKWLYKRMPRWFFALLCELTLRKLQAQTNVKYVRIERSLREYGARPWLCIHGQKDNYITPSIAGRFFASASGPNKEYWLVPKAKHNGCAEKAPAEYANRVTGFFDVHLAGLAPETPVAAPLRVSVPAEALA